MSYLTRASIRVQASFSVPHAKRFTKYLKHKKLSPITRDEKKQYFENNDYCYEHVEQYYKILQDQIKNHSHIKDQNEKIHKSYAECFPIISLISEGKKEPFS